jgi:hypothetical protein
MLKTDDSANILRLTPFPNDSTPRQIDFVGSLTEQQLATSIQKHYMLCDDDYQEQAANRYVIYKALLCLKPLMYRN